MRRVLVGLTAIAVSLGWLQLAPAFGFPVTATAPMLDRMLGPHREAGAAGWTLLMLGEIAIVAGYFLFVEGRSHWAVGAFAYAVGACLLAGAVLMPLIGLLQGAPPAGDALNNPMRANFFMLNLGLGATAESLIGWLLFGAMLAAGRNLELRTTTFIAAAVAAVLIGAIALWLPGLLARTESSRVFEATLPSITGPAFISVIELPQPPGAVLGPHQHVAGYVLDISGTATMAIAGRGVVDVGAGDALFTAFRLRHDHQNRAAIPIAIALALVLLGLTAAVLALRRRPFAVLFMAAALVAGTVATVNPWMNHWYFIAVRPAAQRGFAMPVPAGHGTYASENLKGLTTGHYVERLTNRHLAQSELARFSGPAAIVVLDGKVSVTTGGRAADLQAQAGITVAGGEEASVRADSGDARVLVVELIPSI